MAEGSAKFAGLPSAVRARVDLLVTALCRNLASVAESLTPKAKGQFVTAYQAGVSGLARDGWLTATQAALLINLSKAL